MQELFTMQFTPDLKQNFDNSSLLETSKKAMTQIVRQLVVVENGPTTAANTSTT